MSSAGAIAPATITLIAAGALAALSSLFIGLRLRRHGAIMSRGLPVALRVDPKTRARHDP